MWEHQSKTTRQQCICARPFLHRLAKTRQAGEVISNLWLGRGITFLSLLRLGTILLALRRRVGSLPLALGRLRLDKQLLHRQLT